ncbi:DUF805 domain-containing protein [Curvivirga aplysinae]|uniref:DUF805 domain-containing protein n=1 Tax=Curvivirga aplysinae TaxID=2529852 RepID=UPI0012BC0676|nr:DUF805 domain-containing protein [Curvivirga aplysinae]MTI11364.1 DUF805 domain-containing protein [Curvivirga aplysinae]
MQEFIYAWKTCLQFDGCVSRVLYWRFFLVNAAVSFVLILLDINVAGFAWLEAGYGAISLLPFLSMTGRRLHDTGRTGWWMMIILIPAGIILLVYFLCQRTAEKNQKSGQLPIGIIATFAIFCLIGLTPLIYAMNLPSPYSSYNLLKGFEDHSAPALTKNMNLKSKASEIPAGAYGVLYFSKPSIGALNKLQGLKAEGVYITTDNNGTECAVKNIPMIAGKFGHSQFGYADIASIEMIVLDSEVSDDLKLGAQIDSRDFNIASDEDKEGVDIQIKSLSDITGYRFLIHPRRAWTSWLHGPRISPECEKL